MTITGTGHRTAGSFVVALLGGLAGYVLGGLVFVFVALTLPEDPGDRIAGAVGFAALTNLLPTVAAPLVSVVRFRQGRRTTGLGILVGAAVGVAITLSASVALLLAVRDWSHSCPCDPPVEIW